MIGHKVLIPVLYLCLCCGLRFAEKIICESEKHVYLKPNKLYLIESPNFPQTMKKSCGMNFTAKNNLASKDNKIYFIATNGKLNNITFISEEGIKDETLYIFSKRDIYSIYKHSSTELYFHVPFNSSYTAFQAMVVLKNKDTICLPHFLNSSSPYVFNDETELIFLNFYYYDSSSNNYLNNCTWHFRAPLGYKFKIEFHEPNLYSNISFINSGEINKSNATSPIEVYGETLSITHVLHNTDIFQYIVGITKIIQAVKEENCTVTKNGNVTIWTNIDENLRGYSNNARCTFNLTVPWKKEIILSVKYELQYPDSVIMYIGNIPLKLRDNELFLQSKEDKTEENIIFEFASDGNTQLLGFNLTFTERECVCGPSEIIVPCEGSHSYNIMNNEDNHFCAHLQCNFTITAVPLCKHRNIIFETYFFLFDDEAFIEIISNNYSFSYDIYNNNNCYIMLLSNRTNNLRFSSKKHGIFRFSLTVVKPIIVEKHVILTSDAPSYVLDAKIMTGNSVFTVILDDHLMNDSIEVFLDNYYQTFIMYTNENLICVAKQRIVIESNSVNLYFAKKGYGFVIFRAIKSHSRNCVFTENVYVTSDKKYRFAMVAKATGDCEIILQASVITEWWTSASEKPVTVYTTNNKPLFAFNKFNSYLWNHVYLKVNSFEFRVFKVVIPANASLIIDTIYLLMAVDRMPIRFSELWSSPFYGEFLMKPISFNETIYAHNNTIIFTIVDLNLSQSASFFLNEIKVTAVEQKFSFAETSVDDKIAIKYNEKEYGYYGFLMKIDYIKHATSKLNDFL